MNTERHRNTTHEPRRQSPRVQYNHALLEIWQQRWITRVQIALGLCCGAQLQACTQLFTGALDGAYRRMPLGLKVGRIARKLALIERESRDYFCALALWSCAQAGVIAAYARQDELCEVIDGWRRDQEEFSQWYWMQVEHLQSWVTEALRTTPLPDTHPRGDITSLEQAMVRNMGSPPIY